MLCNPWLLIACDTLENVSREMIHQHKCQISIFGSPSFVIQIRRPKASNRNRESWQVGLWYCNNRGYELDCKMLHIYINHVASLGKPFIGYWHRQRHLYCHCIMQGCVMKWSYMLSNLEMQYIKKKIHNVPQDYVYICIHDNTRLHAKLKRK